jgi:hypothetical protein
MKNNVKILIGFFMMGLLHNSCSILNRSRIKSKVDFIKANEKFIKECSAFSIEKSSTKFNISAITDKKVRNKISALGENVYVHYKDDNYEIPDSNVTFESFSLLYGITEIVYDFASNNRKFKTVGSSKSDYYFIQIADRIYFRRRPIPMM